ncbi:MAG TPA: metallophosphoesterase [Candidatus Lokiarchaeia archaeon]|nr:metallophosphoesterase [Candidatus Lokiarchaeia archaeon]
MRHLKGNVLQRRFIIALWVAMCFVVASTSTQAYQTAVPLNTKGQVVAPNPAGKVGIQSSGSGQGVITTSTGGVIWWLHITDTQDVWYNASKIAWFREFLNSTQHVIGPAFIFNTGDLVNDDTQGFFGGDPGQKVSDWTTYAEILNETGMNNSYYYDIIGNHDCYSDPGNFYYFNDSMQKQLNYDFMINTSFGNYHFIGLDTEAYHGIKYPFEMFGHINQTALDWYQSALAAHADANVTVVFGHTPGYEIFEGFDRFFALNRQYNVAVYLTGHGHENSWQLLDNRVVSWETRIFGAFNDSYRICAIDNDGFATSTESKDSWPVGVITSPVDFHNVYASYDRAKLASPTAVHVLAWDPFGVASVEWRATLSGEDQNTWTPWIAMQLQSGPLYSAPADARLADGATHLLQARILSTSGAEKIEQIEYQSTPVITFGWWAARPLLAVVILGACTGVPAVKYAGRRAGRFKPKRPDEQVDPVLRKIFLVKLACMFILPLTFATIFPGEVVAVFGLFYWGTPTFYVSALNLLFFMAGWGFGLLLPLLALSPRKRYQMLGIFMPLSIGTSAFLLVYYVATVSLIALVAPGYYMGFACDFLMMRRSVTLIKEMR